VNEDKATRYHRLKRRAKVASLAWNLLLLAGLLATGLSAMLRTASESAAAYAPRPFGAALTVIIYVIGLSFMNEIGSLPIAFYSGFILERRYGLSTEPVRAWLKDETKSFVVGLLLGAGAASLVYLLIRWSPTGWWLPAGVLFALLIVGLTNLAPVALLPLFYRMKPLDRKSLRARLLALAERAGARVLDAYEWGLSAKTRKANAALTGLGATRRILVSDTMLAEYSDEEIEIVLAHELAHHVHGDIWKGLAFESALLLAAFQIAARVLGWSIDPLDLRGAADVAALPLIVLVAGAVSLVMGPIAHAMSRAYERRADRFALELTKNPAAFISAMRRLSAQNLAEEKPTKAIQWLFYSHPPIGERIAAAEEFKG
jgi:Zn-dependent protease with chaperone function